MMEKKTWPNNQKAYFNAVESSSRDKKYFDSDFYS